MKTVDEALDTAYKIAGENAYFGNGFKAGITFIQRWISVEEELPNSDNEANWLSKVVIAKSKNLADEVSAYYDYAIKTWRIYPSAKRIKVTEWRPIERS